MSAPYINDVGDVETTPTRYECLTVLTAASQNINGVDVLIESGSDPMSGLPNVKSVCDAVIRKVQELDTLDVVMRISGHRSGVSLQERRHMTDEQLKDVIAARLPHGYKVGERFPAHAMIRVDTKETARDVAEYLNQKFRNDRGLFPRISGWNAEVVVGGASASFDETHSFFRYKETGRLDSKCSRIIVVVDLAVEGMNNKYLLVEGVARPMFSLRKSIQSRGRLLRSAAQWEGIPFSSVLIVPPEAFDRIYVITHEAFRSQTIIAATNNVEIAESSLAFIENMAATMGLVMTLDEYINIDVDHYEDSDNWSPRVDWGTCCRITAEIGRYKNAGKSVRIKKIMEMFAGQNAPRAKRLYFLALIESGISGRPMPYPVKRDGRVVEDFVLLADLVERGLNNHEPEPEDILFSEKISRSYMDEEECKKWLGEHKLSYSFDQLVGERGSIHAAVVFVNELEELLSARHTNIDLNINETPAARMQRIADELCTKIDASPQESQIVKGLVDAYVMRLLERQGIVDVSELGEGGKLCDPAITYLLRQEKLVSKLHGYIANSMLMDGHLSNIQAILALRPDTRDDM